MGAHGYLISGTTAAWIRGQMERKAPGSAAEGQTRHGRPAFAVEDEFARPFEVRFASSIGDGSDNSGKWIIWLPSTELLTVDGEPLDLSSYLEPAGGDYPDGWFKLSGIESSGGQVWLNVKGGENDTEGDAAPVEFASAEDSDSAFSVLIAETSVSDSGAVSVKQLVCSSLVLSSGANGDEVSVGVVTDKDAKDPNALQVKNFDNEESDGGQGLAERLELEKSGSGESATYRIKAKSNDSKVHLVARVNGKIKYIPISGNDEKDPDEENPPPEDNPCTHPGDGDNGGGIKPDDDEPGGGGGAGGGGGVAPGGGGTHPGNDNCNCD